MTSLKGFEQIKFDDCYSIVPTAIIEEIPLKFLHIRNLIESKKASARPKGLIDAEELEKILRQK